MDSANSALVRQEMATQANACEQQPSALEGALRESPARHDRNLETLSDQIQQLTQAGQVSVATAFSNSPVCAVSCPEPHLSGDARRRRAESQRLGALTVGIRYLGSTLYYCTQFSTGDTYIQPPQTIRTQ